MSKIINLKQVKKQKARAAKADMAAQNRLTHGTPKALRDGLDAGRDASARALDGHRLGDDAE